MSTFELERPRAATLPAASDAELLHDLSDGSDSANRALTILRARYERSLRLVLRNLVSEADADDALQMTWYALYRHAPSLVVHTTLWGWLRKTAVNFGIDFYRRQRHSVARDAEQFATIEEECVLVHAERQQAVSDCLAELTPRARDVIWRWFFECQSTIEIAKRIRATAANVYKIKQRALHALKACLETRLP